MSLRDVMRTLAAKLMAHHFQSEEFEEKATNRGGKVAQEPTLGREQGYYGTCLSGMDKREIGTSVITGADHAPSINDRGRLYGGANLHTPRERQTGRASQFPAAQTNFKRSLVGATREIAATHTPVSPGCDLPPHLANPQPRHVQQKHEVCASKDKADRLNLSGLDAHDGAEEGFLDKDKAYAENSNREDEKPAHLAHLKLDATFGHQFLRSLNKERELQNCGQPSPVNLAVLLGEEPRALLDILERENDVSDGNCAHGAQPSHGSSRSLRKCSNEGYR